MTNCRIINLKRTHVSTEAGMQGCLTQSLQHVRSGRAVPARCVVRASRPPQQRLLVTAQTLTCTKHTSRRACLLALVSGFSLALARPGLAQESSSPETIKPTQQDATSVDLPAEAEPVPVPKEKANGDLSNAAENLSEDEAKKLLDEEEERRKLRRRKKGRLRELEEIRAELAEKQLELFQKEQELLEKEQTVMVLREELEIEKRIRVLLTKEKEKAAEEAALAMGLCVGGAMLP